MPDSCLLYKSSIARYDFVRHSHKFRQKKRLQQRIAKSKMENGLRIATRVITSQVEVGHCYSYLLLQVEILKEVVAADSHWVVVEEPRRERQAGEIVAVALQLPHSTAERIGHMPHNHRRLRMGRRLQWMRSTAHTENNRYQVLGYPLQVRQE